MNPCEGPLTQVIVYEAADRNNRSAVYELVHDPGSLHDRNFQAISVKAVIRKKGKEFCNCTGGSWRRFFVRGFPCSLTQRPVRGIFTDK